MVWHDARSFVASVKFIVVTPGGAQPFDAFYGNLTATSRNLTYQDLAHNPQVILRLEDQLGLSESASDISGRIAVVQTQTPVFDVLVADKDPDMARNIANALANNMIKVSDEVQKVDGSAAGLVLVDPASGAADARGKVSSAMLKGGLLGLVSSTVLILGYGLLKGTVTDRRQIARIVKGTSSSRAGR